MTTAYTFWKILSDPTINQIPGVIGSSVKMNRSLELCLGFLWFIRSLSNQYKLTNLKFSANPPGKSGISTWSQYDIFSKQNKLIFKFSVDSEDAFVRYAYFYCIELLHRPLCWYLLCWHNKQTIWLIISPKNSICKKLLNVKISTFSEKNQGIRLWIMKWSKEY